MVLTEYPFSFFDNKESFSKVWSDCLKDCEGKTIQNIWGVWDHNSNQWMDDAPMLLELEQETLAINVRSERFLSLVWNGLRATDKIEWFNKDKDARIIAELNWQEALAWKEYGHLFQFKGAIIRRIEVISNADGLIGLCFRTNIDSFVIVDNGDVIAGFLESEWKKFPCHI